MSESIPFFGRILDTATSELGEGPTFDAATGTAWWFDIKGKTLHELHVESGTKKLHSLPFLGSVLALIDPLRQLIASDQGLFLRDTRTGALSAYGQIENNAGNRSNDGRVHASGSLWISTMGRSAEREAGAIYHVAKGTVTKLFANLTIPNAICFSPDGATAYFVDTDDNRMMRVPLDPETGLPNGDAALLSDQSGTSGGVDGSVCDADGLIWNARWGASCVDVYQPDGTRVRRYEVPALQPSCPAFIGANAERLLITTAYEGMDAAARKADPAGGQTLDLGITVKGRFEPFYRP